MKKSFLILTVLIGFSVSVFNSCSKSSDSTTPSTTQSPVGGKWKTTISTSSFYLTLNNDYSYTFNQNTSAPYESGTYTLLDTTITFVSTSANSCPGMHGKYSYKIDTATAPVITPRLNITLMSDSCSARVTLAVGKWLKQ